MERTNGSIVSVLMTVYSECTNDCVTVSCTKGLYSKCMEHTNGSIVSVLMIVYSECTEDCTASVWSVLMGVQ
jgi:hypothetical protein